MKTLEHEIRDVLSGKDLEELKLLEEFIDYSAENYVITEEDEQYLVEAIPLAIGIALGAAGRALLGGIIRNAPRIGQSILNSLKRGGQRAKVLSRRLSRAAKRRKGAIGAAALSSGGGDKKSAEDSATGNVDVQTGKIQERGGSNPGVKTITFESREDIEATPRFTETNREKIDVVPRAENDLEAANRKRFRMENIKKKIIDDEFNIRNEFNNFLIEENIELTEEEYDEAFDILFQYFVQDLNENIGSTLYKGLGFAGRRVLAPAIYASDAYENYKKGDTRGALTSGAKAVASVNPFGAAASMGHDLYKNRKYIAGVAKQGYDYVKRRLFGKPKPSNQISQNKRKPSGLQKNRVS